jgi:hypothetical protein
MRLSKAIELAEKIHFLKQEQTHIFGDISKSFSLSLYKREKLHRLPLLRGFSGGLNSQIHTIPFRRFLKPFPSLCCNEVADLHSVPSETKPAYKQYFGYA